MLMFALCVKGRVGAAGLRFFPAMFHVEHSPLSEGVIALYIIEWF